MYFILAYLLSLFCAACQDQEGLLKANMEFEGRYPQCKKSKSLNDTFKPQATDILFDLERKRLRRSFSQGTIFDKLGIMNGKTVASLATNDISVSCHDLINEKPGAMEPMKINERPTKTSPPLKARATMPFSRLLMSSGNDQVKSKRSYSVNTYPASGPYAAVQNYYTSVS